MGSPARHLLTDLVLARSHLDRAAERRGDAAWLAHVRREPTTRVLLMSRGRTPVVSDDQGTRIATVGPEALPEGCATFLLGTDLDGTTYLAARLPGDDSAGGPAPFRRGPADAPDVDVPPGAPAGSTWSDLRQAGSVLGARDAGLFVTAVALANWHDTHPRCPRCGGRTEVVAAGWARRCPADDSEHYPRTDPAVIVLVIDDQDRALLGRQARWPEGWFSTLAGFVEAGESAEAAVRREVQEESGVVIGPEPDEVTYLGSQPWPFPSSLMLGYHARAASPEVQVDGEEIAEARWFSRAELAAACADGSVRLPPPVSIARKLVERWYGGALPHDWSRA